jgi:hypothetical protein
MNFVPGWNRWWPRNDGHGMVRQSKSKFAQNSETAERVRIIGVYPIRVTKKSLRAGLIRCLGEEEGKKFPIEDHDIPNARGLCLIEVLVNNWIKGTDIGGFCQETVGHPRDCWQVAYDEKFLDENGTKVVDEPETARTARFAFFLHEGKFDQPLITPFGSTSLAPRKSLPKRLDNLFVYGPPC